jgi:hypothetical protein
MLLLEMHAFPEVGVNKIGVRSGPFASPPTTRAGGSNVVMRGAEDVTREGCRQLNTQQPTCPIAEADQE